MEVKEEKMPRYWTKERYDKFKAYAELMGMKVKSKWRKNLRNLSMEPIVLGVYKIGEGENYSQPSVNPPADPNLDNLRGDL